jgi:hypothetical protein
MLASGHAETYNRIVAESEFRCNGNDHGRRIPGLAPSGQGPAARG